MAKSYDRSDASPVPPSDPVGIVVHDTLRGAILPRAVAFVWGGEVRPAPSLPFGRWKDGVLSPA